MRTPNKVIQVIIGDISEKMMSFRKISEIKLSWHLEEVQPNYEAIEE